MSSELMPVLSFAIINFKKFMAGWEKLGELHDILKPWTNIGLYWAYKYYRQMDDTDAYVLAMCKAIHLLFTALIASAL